MSELELMVTPQLEEDLQALMQDLRTVYIRDHFSRCLGDIIDELREMPCTTPEAITNTVISHLMRASSERVAKQNTESIWRICHTIIARFGESSDLNRSANVIRMWAGDQSTV